MEYPGNDYQRMILQECVEAYLQLDENEQQQFEQLVHTEPYREIEPMMLTTFEKGVAKGREEGLRQAARILLESRFGPLSEAVLARLASLPVEKLDELLADILKATSLWQLGLEAGEAS